MSEVSGRIADLTDMDSDGGLDALVLNPGISVELVLGAGQSASPEVLEIDNGPFFALTATSADADAILDIAALRQNSVQVLIGAGGGAFDLGDEIEFDGAGAIGIAALDVDADGDSDLFVAKEVNALLLVNEGGFQAPVEITTESPFPSFVSGDVAVGDFDGLPGNDVVMHGNLVFASDGAGGLSGVQSVGSGTGGFATIGSFDPGLPEDLAIAEVADFGSGAATLSIALGTREFFGEALSLSTGCDECFARDKLSVADVNDDDDSDLVYPSPQGISILLGCGDGTFAGPLSIAFEEPLQRVMVGELDGASWPDLITTDANATKLDVLLGQGESG